MFFLLGRMYFTANDGYQFFLVFAPMLNSLTLDKKNYRISIPVSPEKIKPFNTNLELTVSNLTNCRVILKFNNSVLVHKMFYSLYSNSIFNLYIVYELSSWPRNRINIFH